MSTDNLPPSNDGHDKPSASGKVDAPENSGLIEETVVDPNPRRLDTVRGWLNRNSLTVTLVSNLVLLCALGTIVMQVRPKAPPPWPMAYYYDLAKETVFVARTTEFPPVFTPTSNSQGKREGVRAYVFSCGDCSRGDTRKYIGFLEAYTDEAKTKLEEVGGYRVGAPNAAPGPMMPDVMYMMSNDGHLLSTPEQPDKWVGANSEEGRNIVTDAMKRCGLQAVPRSCSADEDPTWQPTAPASSGPVTSGAADSSGKSSQ